MTNSSSLPIDRTLSGGASPGHSGPGSYGSEGVLRIPQGSSITGASPSDCLMLYPRHSCCGGGSYPNAEFQLMYSTASADWTVYKSKLLEHIPSEKEKKMQE